MVTPNRILLPTAILLLLALTALGARCFNSPSHSSKEQGAGTVIYGQTPGDATPPSTPFSGLLGRIPNTAQDAGDIARDLFTGCPPWCGSQIASIDYVETTAGGVRQFFGPGKAGHPDDPGDVVGAFSGSENLKVWLVVAHGTFRESSVLLKTPLPTVNNLWAVVPYGQANPQYVATNKNIDLSQLGTVHHILLPLPPFPTPVGLD